MTTPFADKVLAATDQLGTLCAGVDPSSALMASWGLADTADGLAEFSSALS